jgi:hypothetical protein
MPSLITYRKATDSITTHTLRLPQPEKQGEQAGQELCTLSDGRTVVALFDGYTLPADQPAAIRASIEVLPEPLPDDLRAEIRQASPHMRLIATRLIERIRAKYTQDDERFLTRIACGQALGTRTMTPDEQAMIADYQATAESARAWARAEREKLGV